MSIYKRMDEATPSDGVYSEIYYLNDKGESVDESEATRCIIRECDGDGRLIHEIYGVCGKEKEQL